MGRRYPGQRAIRITLRTAHIGAASLVLGAATFGGDPGWAVFVLFATGSGIAADSLYKEGLDWLRYLSGWAVIVKLALLGVGLVRPELLLPCLWAALIVGGLISHAPGKIRHAALWGPPGPCARPRERSDPAPG